MLVFSNTTTLYITPTLPLQANVTSKLSFYNHCSVATPEFMQALLNLYVNSALGLLDVARRALIGSKNKSNAMLFTNLIAAYLAA